MLDRPLAQAPRLLLPPLRPQMRGLQLLHHLHLLLQQVVEKHDLVLELHPDVVRHEEPGVLLLQLLPNELGEPGLDPGLVLEREDDILLRHVLLQAPLDEVLDILDVSASDGVAPVRAVVGKLARSLLPLPLAVDLCVRSRQAALGPSRALRGLPPSLIVLRPGHASGNGSVSKTTGRRCPSACSVWSQERQRQSTASALLSVSLSGSALRQPRGLDSLSLSLSQELHLRDPRESITHTKNKNQPNPNCADLLPCRSSYKDSNFKASASKEESRFY
mmetsp:Transcript_6268/g.18984  ORF Transcript_6268/g.18984 Transcript_6268/m.18984 type:complete len:276 (+) Transcript_6268:758-1585(+)